MSPTVFRLVLLISCTHSMVHIFEISVGSVEQRIGDEFGVGKDVTGELGLAWRIPFGLGAILAGWLADRFGSKPMLLIYLAGCITTCLLAWWAPTMGVLFGVMFTMGCFASIYHPAGLAIISRETTDETRSAALGWHGIFGSVGIALAPFLANVMLNAGFSWRQYYLLLMVPGVVLAIVIQRALKHEVKPAVVTPQDATGESLRERWPDWRPYGLLVTTGALSGVVYAALMHFISRYLSGGEVPAVIQWIATTVSTISGSDADTLSAKEMSGYGASIVLLCGAVGQGIAGRIGRPRRLRWLLIVVLGVQVPCLGWMAVAKGSAMFWAACLMALFHFMNQPIYNSLIAQFVPHHRRSIGYGFSNMMCFGLGALGPAIVGSIPSDLAAYGVLAGVALAATLIAVVFNIQLTMSARLMD